MTDAERTINDLREQIARLELLLIRKNEALSLFAKPKMWIPWRRKVASNWIWNGDGGGAYRNPMDLAKREREADEPCS